MPVNVNLTNVVGDYVPIGGGTMTGNLTLNDDIVALFGSSGTVSLLYETADANANALILTFPEGGGTDVPVLAIGDASILNVDLGAHNGVTEPTVAIWNDAADAYASLDAGDDAVAGSRGLYFKAAADEDIELLNLSVTGTPRVYWDESEDQIRSTKGWVFDAACDVQGTWVATATWTLPAFTLGGAITANSNAIDGLDQIYGVVGASAFWIRGRRQAASSGQGVGVMTYNASDADTTRLVITSGVNTAVATWTDVTHTGLVITSAGLVEGAGTGANGFKIKNPKNAAASALSGTQLDVEIDIGGTPYYFTTYPTKA